jgi:isopenicillin N synthase-like dioxygenase
MSIPVVDLADFLSGDPQRKAAFVESLGKAYEEVGFVAVKNHGVPDELIANQYEYVQQFFSLPLEKKLEYEVPGLAGQRGYTSFGREHAKGSDAPDLKEFFNMARPLLIMIPSNPNTRIMFRLMRSNLSTKHSTMLTAILKKAERLYYRPLHCTWDWMNIILISMYTMEIPFSAAYTIHPLPMNRKARSVRNSMRILT